MTLIGDEDSIRIAPDLIERPRLISSLIVFGKCSFGCHVMMIRTEGHHVLGSEMIVNMTGNDVMVLNDWPPAYAATEPSLLT